MKYLALLTAIFLVGCGSDDEGTPAALSDIVGVWDDSVTIGQETDEWYFVIHESGQVIDYDYYGDSYDQGENCYSRSVSQLTDQGNGVFLVEDTESNYSATVNITISGNTMTVSGSDEDGSYSDSSTRSSRLESDFSPLCNDAF